MTVTLTVINKVVVNVIAGTCCNQNIITLIILESLHNIT